MYSKFFNENEKYIKYTTTDGMDIIIHPTVDSVVGKYDEIFTLTNQLLNDNKLKDMYDNFMKDLIVIEPSKRMDIFNTYSYMIISKLDKMFDDMHIADQLNVKTTKSELSITKDEAKIIMRTSLRYRLFFVLYMSDEFMLDNSKLIEFHSIICKEFLENHINDKIFSIIKSMVATTIKFNKKKKSVWKLLADSCGVTSESFELELYNSIFYKGIINMVPDQNPITFLIILARNKLTWFLKTNITYIGIPDANVDSSTMMGNKNYDLLETHLFYKLITRTSFTELSNEYNEYSKLHLYNMYVTLNIIAAPIIHKLFKKHIKNLNFNFYVLNFLAHKILSECDADKYTIRNILLSVPILNKQNVLSDENKSLVVSVLNGYQKNLNDKSFNPITIKKFFIESMSLISNYDYYSLDEKSPSGLTKIDIDWHRFIIEFVDYIFNLLNGDYNKIIEKYRKIYFSYNDQTSVNIEEINIEELLGDIGNVE